MIRAYILIETNAGEAYKYVRDVVADTDGVGGKFYRYRGQGYQALDISPISEQTFTPLQFDVRYYITIGVDGGATAEYNIFFPSPSNDIGVLNTRGGSIRYFELVEALNRVANGEWVAKIVDKDLRITSTDNTTSSAVAITAGATGTDLLAALDSTPASAVGSDVYADQTGAGKVAGDFATLLANWATAYTTATPGFLSFPESGGATTQLKRLNKSIGGDDDDVYTITQIAGANISTIKVVEQREEDAVYNP